MLIGFEHPSLIERLCSINKSQIRRESNDALWALILATNDEVNTKSPYHRVQQKEKKKSIPRMNHKGVMKHDIARLVPRSHQPPPPPMLPERRRIPVQKPTRIHVPVERRHALLIRQVLIPFRKPGLEPLPHLDRFLQIHQPAAFNRTITQRHPPRDGRGGPRAQEDLVVVHRRRLAAGHVAPQQTPIQQQRLLEPAQPPCEARQRGADVLLEVVVEVRDVRLDDLVDEDAVVGEAVEDAQRAGKQVLAPVGAGGEDAVARVRVGREDARVRVGGGHEGEVLLAHAQDGGAVEEAFHLRRRRR